MAIIGYARISKSTENIERQVRNIAKAYPSARIYKETYSGRTVSRPVFNKVIDMLQSGDTLVVDAVSRFSRASYEGFRLYKMLYDRNVNIVFIKQPQMNTDVYRGSVQKRIDLSIASGDLATDKFLKGLTEILNDYMMDIVEKQFKTCFDQAQAEVENLSQRTKEGIATARLHGKQIGAIKGKKLVTKKSIRAKQLIKAQSKQFGGTWNDKIIIETLHIMPNTYYKYKKECLEEEHEKEIERYENLSSTGK